MSIDYEDLKECAVRLAAPEGCETDLRASMSRSYYAAFHRLLPLASELPKSKKSKPDQEFQVGHTELAERFAEWRVEKIDARLVRLKPTAVALVKSLDVARAQRVIADYRLDRKISHGDAKHQLERVKKILRAIAQIEAERNSEAA